MRFRYKKIFDEAKYIREKRRINTTKDNLKPLHEKKIFKKKKSIRRDFEMSKR